MLAGTKSAALKAAACLMASTRYIKTF
jgi:hypothetical protein